LKESTYKDYSELPLFLNAEAVAKVLGVSPSIGLGRGALLVYVYLVYHKSLPHSANDLNCASIGKAVGLCEKTVRQHLRTLEDQGLIRLAVSRGHLSYELCPLRDKVRGRRNADLLPVPERGWST